jgi:hypothetical protein
VYAYKRRGIAVRHSLARFRARFLLSPVLMLAATSATAQTVPFVGIRINALSPAESEYLQQATGSGATVRTTAHLRRGVTFEPFGGAMVTSRLGVLAAFSPYTSSRPTDVFVSVPHLFTAGATVSDTGTSADEHRHKESRFDLDALVALTRAPRLRVFVFAGASRFGVRHDQVRDVTIIQTVNAVLRTDAIEVEEDSIVTETETVSAWGGNLGVMVEWGLAPQVGVNVTGRFSRGTANLTNFAAQEAFGRDGVRAPMKVGGAEIGGGLTVRFGKQ